MHQELRIGHGTKQVFHILLIPSKNNKEICQHKFTQHELFFWHLGSIRKLKTINSEIVHRDTSWLRAGAVAIQILVVFPAPSSCRAQSRSPLGGSK